MTFRASLYLLVPKLCLARIGSRASGMRRYQAELGNEDDIALRLVRIDAIN